MKPIFPLLCAATLISHLQAEEKQLPLATQAAITGLVQSLAETAQSPDLTLEQARVMITRTAEMAKTALEGSQQKADAETDALLATIESACLAAEEAAALDSLFAAVTKRSSDAAVSREGYRSSEPLRAAATIVGCWQDYLIARDAGDSRGATKALDEILRSLAQSPCIGRSKVLVIKKALEADAKAQQSKAEAKNMQDRIAQDRRNQEEMRREQEEMRLKQNPPLADPEWPEAISEYTEVVAILVQLQAAEKEQKALVRGHGNTKNYGAFAERLKRLQLASAESSAARHAEVIQMLGSGVSKSTSPDFYERRSFNEFPPPISLVSSIADLEAQLVRGSFHELFGTVAAITPKGKESPRAYAARLADTLAAESKFTDLLELLPLINISGLFEAGSDGDWIIADIAAIQKFQEGQAFLKAADLRNAVPALRETIENGKRKAPVAQAAKALAELKEKHPEEMKRIR